MLTNGFVFTLQYGFRNNKQLNFLILEKSRFPQIISQREWNIYCWSKAKLPLRRHAQDDTSISRAWLYYGKFSLSMLKFKPTSSLVWLTLVHICKYFKLDHFNNFLLVSINKIWLFSPNFACAKVLEHLIGKIIWKYDFKLV